MPGPLSRMLAPGILALAALIPAATANAATTVRTYTGTEQTFVVPAGVTALRVVATGAKGGSGIAVAPVPGGFGAVVAATLSVTPGQIFYVEVGGGGLGGGSCCTNAFNGGGKAGDSSIDLEGGGGGGASDIRTLPRTDPSSLSSRVVVAAGGGGGGGGDTAGNGGAGAQPGQDIDGGAAGPGGPNSGGTAGAGSVAGFPGTAGTGGEGATDNAGGGGGGGGWYGGGGGGAGDASQHSGGGGGGSNLIPIGGTGATATTATASVSFTDVPASGGGTGGGGGGGSQNPILAAAGNVAFSRSAFPAAPSGPSAQAAQRRRRRYGTTVSYRLTQAASVRFTVQRRQRGRSVRRRGRRRCVKPTRSNRRARRCTRYVTLRGSFTLAGKAGSNRFRFTGRLRRRKLSPGRYRLVATPIVAGRRGIAARAGFRIVR